VADELQLALEAAKQASAFSAAKEMPGLALKLALPILKAKLQADLEARAHSRDVSTGPELAEVRCDPCGEEHTALDTTQGEERMERLVDGQLDGMTQLV